MPPRPRPIPQVLGEVFTVRDAAAIGVTPTRLRAPDLRTPFRGVRARPDDHPAPTDTAPGAIDRAERARVRELVTAYARIIEPHAFLAGRTALIWHGVSVPHGPDLEIGVLAPQRAPRRRGIRGRKIAPHLVHCEIAAGVLVATPAPAWATAADGLSVHELIRVGDQLVRIPRDDHGVRHPELQRCTMDQLAAAVDAGRRPGIGRLREALERIRVGSMSPLETDARCQLVAAGLPEPELDVEIRDETGRLLGIADGAYRRHRVLLEIEGDHHRTDPAQWARDLEKHAAYAAAGWALVRLARPHIRGQHPPAASMVRAALARAGADLN